MKAGLNEIQNSEFGKSPIITNTVPCVANAASQDLYMFYFNDATGKYSVSGYTENAIPANIANMILSYNSGTTCGTFGRNYAVGTN